MFKKMLSAFLVMALIFGGGGTSVRADELENPEEGFEINGEYFKNLEIALETDISEEVVAGQGVTFNLSITNPNDCAVEHVFTGLGRLNYDEGCFELFTDIVESEDYEIVQDLDANKYDAYIDNLGAGETVNVTFTGNVWGSWAGQDVDIIAATFVQPEKVNGQDFLFINEQCVSTHVNYPWEIERGYILDGEPVDLNDIPSICPGQELIYSLTVRNVSEVALEHVWVGCGIYDMEGRINEIIATQSDRYDSTENGAYIVSLGVGEEVTVEFACLIDETWTRAEEICFVNGVTQTSEKPYNAEPVCFEHFFDANYILEPLEVKLEMDAPNRIASGSEVTFTASITNPNSFAINHVFTGLGRWNQEEVKFDLFTDIVPNDAYEIYKDLDKNQYDAYIATIGAGETITVTFKGVIKDEWDGKNVDFVLATFVQPEAVNGGDFYFIDEQAITASVYKMESNTNNAVSKEELLTKPVETITVVKDEVTENDIKIEMISVVEKLLKDDIATGVGNDVFSQKVKQAVESGKNITAELVVDEIAEESVTTIEEEVRIEIEKEAIAELGEAVKLQYMDISIMVKAEDGELGALKKLQKEIAITIAIPNELKGEGYVYKVIRNHDGEITALDTKDNGDGTITFKTDSFSTYALAYSEKVEKPNTPDTSTGSDASTAPGTSTTQESTGVVQESPKTSDSNVSVFYISMMICAVVLLSIINRKRIKN